MSQRLLGKVAIITGASSGIGEATAVRLASEGVKVVLAARRVDRLEKVKRQIESEGGEALCVPTDVTRRDQVETLVQKTYQSFGRADILFNNAGIMPLSFMKKGRVDEWEKTIDVNIKGVLYGIAAILPRFLSQKSGHIINMSSVGGRRVYPGCAVYNGTKFAVRAISQSLRMELASEPGLKVTVIEPGAVTTELPEGIQDQEFKETFKSFAATLTFLEPNDIAESIFYAVSQADRVNVEEILVMPREQGN
ncbi:MAG: SDR family oxidoreductase [Deltaproteobacteria bacterium]|nr:SDR family oxidoreductase [Deltaproteobacteria bacterium]